LATSSDYLRASRLDNEQAQAQLELKDRALAATAEGITIADLRLPDNPLIYANAGFERLTGYSVAEVIGRNCRFLQGPATDPATVDALRRAIRERHAVTVQLLNYRKDGTPFWNRLSITPVADSSGAVTHFIGVQSDVTAEKEARDALQEANRRLEAAGEALRQDLQAAADLQRALLPAELPSFAGLSFTYQFRPSTDVGGDALNVIPLDDEHVAIYMLDVAGHGVAAALLSVTLTHMLSPIPDRSFLYRSSGAGQTIASPAEVVSRLNTHFLSSPGAPGYFTMIFGLLEKGTGVFRYVAAGHLGPILVAPGRTPAPGETGGIPVGLLPTATYEEHVIALAPGDRLFFFTDGIMEAENRSEEEFGVERLLDALGANRGLSLNEAVASIMDRIEQWSAPDGPTDDASILAIERLRPS
jgi:sigma-B regulation protein RsbU (phosphoserine phosphatase)